MCQKEAAASGRRRLPDFEADWSRASSGYQNRGPCCHDDPFRKPSYGEMQVRTDPHLRGKTVAQGRRGEFEDQHPDGLAVYPGIDTGEST